MLSLSLLLLSTSIVLSEKISTDGEISLENTSVEKRINKLEKQILELQTHIKLQENIINDLNETLNSFVFTSDEYGYGLIYDKTDDRPLLLTSSHSHIIPFVMLNVISVRLPKRDSYVKKDRGKKSKFATQKRRKKGAKTRYIHVIVTLSSDGIFQLWDDEQNELYNYFDSSISTNNTSSSSSSSSNFIVYSDIVTQNKYGNTWLVMATNHSQFVKVYAVSCWRDYINDKINKKISKSIIEGQITPENTIYRPTNNELIQIQNKKQNKNKNINDETCDKTSDETATVTGVTVYQQQRKQYVIVSYSDGLLFSYKPNGVLSSSSNTIPYQSPNKTIIAIATTRKKYQMIIVTEIGFQFLKLPKLITTGPFCILPQNTIINDIQFDVISTTLMYLATNDGELFIYNTKKLNRKMCKSLDNFIVYPNSPLKIDTMPGYLLITSSLGLHVYNVTKKKGSKYIRPALIFVRKFEDEFYTNDDRLYVSNVLISSYTDRHQRTVIAYAQSAQSAQSNNNNNNNNNNNSYTFVVLESYLPSFNASTERGGILNIISKAPIFVGIAMFAFFWIFFKGKGGGGGHGSGGSFGNSPLGRLGKIFSGSGRRNRKTLSRGGSGDIRGKKDRWDARHNTPNIGSANVRHDKKKKYNNYRGKSYKRSFGGFGGADLSD